MASCIKQRHRNKHSSHIKTVSVFSAWFKLKAANANAMKQWRQTMFDSGIMA